MSNPSFPPPRRMMPSLDAIMLEIPEGDDIIGALRSCALGRNLVNLCILSASGVVSDVRLRHPPSGPAPPAAPTTPRVLSGCFDITSFSGIFRAVGTWSLFASFATPDGMLVGGAVEEPLRAAGPVVVAAALVRSTPSLLRLPRRGRQPLTGSDAISGGPPAPSNPPSSSPEELWAAALAFLEQSRH